MDNVAMMDANEGQDQSGCPKKLTYHPKNRNFNSNKFSVNLSLPGKHQILMQVNATCNKRLYVPLY